MTVHLQTVSSYRLNLANTNLINSRIVLTVVVIVVVVVNSYHKSIMFYNI